MNNENRNDWAFVVGVMALIVGALGVGAAIYPKNFFVGAFIVLAIATLPALALPPLNRISTNARLLIAVFILIDLVVFALNLKGQGGF